MDDLDALLADLQNSVPGQPPQQASRVHNYSPVNGQSGASPGYGSVRPKGQQAASPTSPSFQRKQHNGASSTSPTPYSNYTSANSTLNRPGSNNQNNSGNMSELDSLLQDLKSSKYGQSLERRQNAGTPTGGRPLNDSVSRPSVDSLLDELSQAHNGQPIYATINGNNTLDSPTRHVKITVTETKTERTAGTPTPTIQPGEIHETIVTNRNHNAYSSSPQPHHASTATRELDDLMASLSDFKVNHNNSSSNGHQQNNGHLAQTVTTTDYARPNQGVSHIQHSTITEETTRTLTERDQLDSMLGNLHADMSRRGVTTTQKGCCNACEKPIVGQVITALGKTWHPEHFTCNHCNQELGTRNFFERDGQPYCELDYHNLFSPRCAYCNGAILDKCVTALEKTWHTEHFFCAQCGQQFGEDGFHERDGKPYCRTDYFDMFAPKCSGCNRAIMENYISALNAQWHPACFVCRDCKKPVQGKSFYAIEGSPVCPSCVHATGAEQDDGDEEEEAEE